MKTIRSLAIIISLSPVWATSPSHAIIRSRPISIFGSTRSTASVPTSSSNSFTRRRSLPQNTKSVQSVVRRKFRQSATYSNNRSKISPKQPDQQPTLEELRAQLGPVALLVSNTLELTVITIGSYLSGAMLGYVGGSILNIPSTLFNKSYNGILSKMNMLHSKAWVMCKQWGMLSASFSGFHNFVRIARGDVEDGWNAVWGSALTGAFLNRGGGAQAMLQGAATYAGFTYLLDKFFASPSGQYQSAELMYADIPIDD